MYIGSLILAGGDSTRMGKPKESLPFGGSTLLGHTVEKMLMCTHPVMVVARDEAQELPPLPIEAEICFDQTPGEGPFAAIAAGMRAVSGRCDAVVAVSCDLPFMDSSVVNWLADQLGDAELVIPKVDGLMQPMPALYRASALESIERLIAAGERAPRKLADHVKTRVIEQDEAEAFDPDLRFLRNVNTPEAYQQALKDAGDTEGS